MAVRLVRPCKPYESILTNMPLGLPPFEEQREIVARVDQLMRLCDEVPECSHEITEILRVRLLEAVLHDALNATSYSDRPSAPASVNG